MPAYTEVIVSQMPGGGMIAVGFDSYINTCNFCGDVWRDFLLLMDVNEQMSYECFEYKLPYLKFIKIAAKIASVNGPQVDVPNWQLARSQMIDYTR